MVANPGDPAENLRGAPAAVFPVPVGPVALLVVVLNPPVVLRDELRPVLRPREVEVGHPPLDVEGGLDVRLPGLAAIYLLFGDRQGFVNRECLLGAEDAAAVGDAPLGRPVAVYGRVEYGEIGVSVLGERD